MMRIIGTGMRQRRERHPRFIGRRNLAKDVLDLPFFLQYRILGHRCALRVRRTLEINQVKWPRLSREAHTMPYCATVRDSKAAILKTRLVVHGKISSRDWTRKQLCIIHCSAGELAILTQHTTPSRDGKIAAMPRHSFSKL